MRQEEINQLQRKINTLLQENRQLKDLVKMQHEEKTNGMNEDKTPKSDVILKALRDQLSHIKSYHSALLSSVQVVAEVEKALESMIPVMENKFYGFNSTAEKLKSFQNDAETSYAEMVQKLETRVNEIRQEAAEAQEIIHRSYKQKINEMQARIDGLENNEPRPPRIMRKEPTQKRADFENPFSSLSISS